MTRSTRPLDDGDAHVTHVAVHVFTHPERHFRSFLKVETVAIERNVAAGSEDERVGAVDAEVKGSGRVFWSLSTGGNTDINQNRITSNT